MIQSETMPAGTSGFPVIQESSNGGSAWYALHTRSNFEARVYNCLKNKGIESFLPQMLVNSRRKDRRKKILVPLFKGYIFTKTVLSPEKHLEIVKSAGVVRLLGINGKPVPLYQHEVSNLMILNGSDLPFQEENYMCEGDRVRIVEGPFEGLTGIVKHRKGKADRLVVSVDVLMRSVSVELDKWALEKAS